MNDELKIFIQIFKIIMKFEILFVQSLLSLQKWGTVYKNARNFQTVQAKFVLNPSFGLKSAKNYRLSIFIQ